MLISTIAPILLVIFKPVNMKMPSFIPISQFIVTGVSATLSVYAYVVITEKTSLILAYFIVLLPGILIYFNHIKRVTTAKLGQSRVQQIMEANREVYNQAQDIRSEKGAEYGHAVGLVLGMALFIGSAAYFM